MNPSEPQKIESSELRRVDKRTMVYEALMVLFRNKTLLIGFLAIMFFNSGRRGAGLDWVPLLIGFGAVIAALFSYFVVRFGIIGNTFVYKTSSPFLKEEKIIPLDRIQEVEFNRNLLHKMLGLVELKLETGAADSDKEIAISTLKMDDAIALRKEIFERRGGIAAPALIEEQAPENIIFKAGWRHLILAGIGNNAWIFLVVTAGGLLSESNRVSSSQLALIVTTLTKFMDPTRNLFGFILGILAILLLGWIIGISRSIITLYGFLLVRDGERLVRRSGLFNETQKSSPISRIQGIEIKERWLHRVLGLAQIDVGFSMAAAKGERNTPHLCPIIERNLAPKVIRLVFPDIPEEFALKNLPAQTLFWRYAWAPTLFYIVSFGIASQFTKIRLALFLILGVLFIRMIVDEYLRAKNHAWDLEPDFLIVRNGGFSISTAICPLKGIQKLAVDQSFFQKRLGLCDIEVRSASTGVVSSQNLLNVPLENAAPLIQKLKEKLIEDLDQDEFSEPIAMDIIAT